MPVDSYAADPAFSSIRVDYGNRSIVPTRDIHLGYPISLTRWDDDRGIRICELPSLIASKVDAHQVARRVQVLNDSQAVAEIICNNERLAIGTDRETRGKDRCVAPVKTRRRRLC